VNASSSVQHLNMNIAEEYQDVQQKVTPVMDKLQQSLRCIQDEQSTSEDEHM
ncbi:hypothetical protein ACJMK2_034116, partial [Sinanodonta woodiana]